MFQITKCSCIKLLLKKLIKKYFSRSFLSKTEVNIYRFIKEIEGETFTISKRILVHIFQIYMIATKNLLKNIPRSTSPLNYITSSFSKKYFSWMEKSLSFSFKTFYSIPADNKPNNLVLLTSLNLISSPSYNTFAFQI